MVKKLKTKIFFLIMTSLSIVTLGIVTLFTLYNYRNTISTSSFFMDRIYNIDENKEKNMDKPKPEDLDDKRFNSKPEIEGFYSILIKDNQVIENQEITLDDEIKQKALSVSNKNRDNGIIGNYIYNIKRERENETIVMLVENQEAVTHIKVLIISSICISIFSIIIIYIIAKKLSEVIVEPVEKTFLKQVQFISDASHELKTPLAVIEANADVLENEVGENKWIKYIQNEIDSMDKLINELLVLAKIENVDTLNEDEEFNLSQEIELDVSVFESMAYEKNIKIGTNIEGNIKFNGSKEDIKHILSTLVDNAIKHTKENGNIEVNLKKTKENKLIEVKNEGNPIPKEDRERIFERFYRIDKSRNREEKRYGLGLAIAKSTVEKYKGKIEVDYKDGYTVFTVKI